MRAVSVVRDTQSKWSTWSTSFPPFPPVKPIVVIFNSRQACKARRTLLAFPLVAPFYLQSYLFALDWLGFIAVAAPLNYRARRPSLWGLWKTIFSFCETHGTGRL
jgi:hypothetical protein